MREYFDATQLGFPQDLARRFKRPNWTGLKSQAPQDEAAPSRSTLRAVFSIQIARMAKSQALEDYVVASSRKARTNEGQAP